MNPKCLCPCGTALYPTHTPIPPDTPTLHPDFVNPKNHNPKIRMFVTITVRGEGPVGSGGSLGSELAEWRRSEASGHHLRRGLVRRREDEKGKVEEEE